MGFHLVEETLKYAPAGMSASERLLLVVLAHAADDRTRVCWPGFDYIAARTGSDRTTIQRAIKRWELPVEAGGYGWTVRIPHGYDKNDKPVFATKGHRATFAVPRLAPPDESKGSASHPPFAKDERDNPASGLKGQAPHPPFETDEPDIGRSKPQRVGGSPTLSPNDFPKGSAIRPPFPAKGSANRTQRVGDSPTPSSKEQKISLSLLEKESPWTFPDVSDERERKDLETLTRAIAAEKGIRSLEAAKTVMAANGTLDALIAEARQRWADKQPRYRKIHPFQAVGPQNPLTCRHCPMIPDAWCHEEARRLGHQPATDDENTPPPTEPPTPPQSSPTSPLGPSNAPWAAIARLKTVPRDDPFANDHEK